MKTLYELNKNSLVLVTELKTGDKFMARVVSNGKTIIRFVPCFGFREASGRTNNSGPFYTFEVPTKENIAEYREEDKNLEHDAKLKIIKYVSSKRAKLKVMNEILNLIA